MAHRRNEVMAFTGVLGGLGIATATLVATVGKQPVSDPWFILSTVVGVTCTVIFALAGLSAVPDWVRPILEGRPRRRPSAPPIMDYWRYGVDESKVPVLLDAMSLRLVRTSPHFRFVVAMPCDQPDPDAEPDRQFLGFRALLMDQRINGLIHKLITVPDGASWQREPGRPGIMAAQLVWKHEREFGPFASLELPVGPKWENHKERYAIMVLEVGFLGFSRGKLPAPAEFWVACISDALGWPKLLAALLAEFGIQTSGEQPVQVGIELEGSPDLSRVIDTSNMRPMKGRTPDRKAYSFFVADHAGKASEGVAQIMVRNLLLYALKTSNVLAAHANPGCQGSCSCARS